MALEELGRQILARRGKRGVREVAREIGISHATLSRVERGFLPDLKTYEKVCRWLGIEPVTMQAAQPAKASLPRVHFRREKTMTRDTADALAQMIFAVQAVWPPKKNVEDET